MKKHIAFMLCVLILLCGCTPQEDQDNSNLSESLEETTHDHTPAEKRQADSFIVHAEERAEVTEYIICYEEPDGCLSAVATMGNYEQSFLVNNNLIYFVGYSGGIRLYAIDFSGNIQKECMLSEQLSEGWILYSDDEHIYGAAGDVSGNATYIFQTDWNLTECKQIDAYPKQFRQFDYEKVGNDFAELCQADISRIYVHGANVLFDANGMAYEMIIMVSAVSDSGTISGNLLLGWYNQHLSYDTGDMNPWFNKVDESYGSTENLLSLGDFLAKLKGMEDTSVIPDYLPCSSKPFRLTFGIGTPDDLPTANDAVKVYLELTNGTPNTISDRDTTKDYLCIVAKDDGAITGTLYILVD